MKIESIGWGRRATIRKRLVIEMFSDEPQIKKRFSSSREQGKEEHKNGLLIRLDSKFKSEHVDMSNSTLIRASLLLRLET